ncbi:MAG: hypothetical protein KIT62_02270 [Cyclobacteriaceae bacterium]|nr:hypothetical protein [Cyclobacteriaceae bacterium]
MKKLALTLVVALCAHSAFSQTQVLVLGTYHMGNPGLDAFNMEADDVLAPKRQKEIEEFVNLLATFKPTKICLEYPIESQAKLTQSYQAYLTGKSKEQRNETEQIGYRLARKLNLKEVYAIDAKAPFEMDSVMHLAQTGKFDEFMKLMGSMPAFMAAENQKLRESTITQFFEHINSASYIAKSHELYLAIAKVGKDNRYPGADLVADWYKRNLRIYNNLTRLNFKPDDRVLILYGSGHTKILQDLIGDSADFEIVELTALK